MLWESLVDFRSLADSYFHTRPAPLKPQPSRSVMWTHYLRTSSRQKATCQLNRRGQEKTFADVHANINFPIEMIENLRQPREICYVRLGQKRQFLPSRFQSNGRRGVLWTPSSGRKKFLKYFLVGIFSLVRELSWTPTYNFLAKTIPAIYLIKITLKEIT